MKQEIVALILRTLLHHGYEEPVVLKDNLAPFTMCRTNDTTKAYFHATKDGHHVQGVLCQNYRQGIQIRILNPR